MNLPQRIVQRHEFSFVQHRLWQGFGYIGGQLLQRQKNEFLQGYYTLYSFPLAANFTNRFRSGEMPIGISYYEMYNTLAVFAPEIRGDWAFYPIPGTAGTIVDDAGDPHQIINHTSVASGSGAIITAKNAARDADKKYAAWEFLKWWTGTNIQYRFGQEMEGILGSAARHTTANIAALQQLAWPADDLQQLVKQWGFLESDTYVTVNGQNIASFEVANSDGTVYPNVYGVHQMPQIAGSYISGREVENAFREVINNLVNAKETLYEYANNINNEIDRKRGEFGLPLAGEDEED